MLLSLLGSRERLDNSVDIKFLLPASISGRGRHLKRGFINKGVATYLHCSE